MRTLCGRVVGGQQTSQHASRCVCDSCCRPQQPETSQMPEIAIHQKRYNFVFLIKKHLYIESYFFNERKSRKCCVFFVTRSFLGCGTAGNMLGRNRGIPQPLCNYVGHCGCLRRHCEAVSSPLERHPGLPRAHLGQGNNVGCE